MMRESSSLFIWFHSLLLRRKKYIHDYYFVLFLSIIVGILSGLVATLIKWFVHLIGSGATSLFSPLPFLAPAIGLFVCLLYQKFIIRQSVGHGIPNVLYAISKRRGKIKPHNMVSSIFTSAFTVGFGGSVGLEGPTVSTGAAIASNLGRLFRLEFRQIVLLLGCAAAGTMSAIFKAPIAAIFFALEVLFLDLSMRKLIPIIFSSITAIVTAFLFTEQERLYPFHVIEGFVPSSLIYYILLGLFAGFVSLYFRFTYIRIEEWFEKRRNDWVRALTGAAIIGALVWLFPALYGEGYETSNAGLSGNGNYAYLFPHSFLEPLQNNVWGVIGLLTLLIALKAIATAVTFGGGGIGGIFAPTLFMGVNTGVLFAYLVNIFRITPLPVNTFALLGMAATMAGVLFAPLTALFLIADLSGGYTLFIPLMIVTSIAFGVVRLFSRDNVYTYQLAHRQELISRHMDKTTLFFMEVEKFIETDFIKIPPQASLRELVQSIEKSPRNLFPVVSETGDLVGMIKLDDVRHLIFHPEKYDHTQVKDLMYMPDYTISSRDSAEELVDKFKNSGRFNIAVVDDGKYRGFISRARVFTEYRELVRDFSEE